MSISPGDTAHTGSSSLSHDDILRGQSTTTGARAGLNGATVAHLRTVIADQLNTLRAAPVRVLEAGGGSATFLRGCDERLAFTTIDISQQQLDRNKYAVEKILGDLQTFDYRARRFDVALFWDVLEHLPSPDLALAKVLKTLDPGGIVVLKGPIPTSLKGLVTKWTPHFVHVLFYRWILDKPDAGKPGHAPFRTALETEAGPDFLRRVLEASGFTVVAEASFITNQVERLKTKFLPAYYLYLLLSHALLFLSRGRYGRFESDFYLVGRRG